jgi:hypothetical protein
LNSHLGWQGDIHSFVLSFKWFLYPSSFSYSFMDYNCLLVVCVGQPALPCPVVGEIATNVYIILFMCHCVIDLKIFQRLTHLFSTMSLWEGILSSHLLPFIKETQAQRDQVIPKITRLSITRIWMPLSDWNWKC